jgi:hypothetical protein
VSDSGRVELVAANQQADRTIRRLWLVAGIQAIVARPVFLVGGAAVDLHTGSYRPTDVDIVGVVSGEDLTALVEAGFVDLGGRHLKWIYSDGTAELVEFPETTLDGDFEQVQLGNDVVINVISTESLIVDRIHQATDGTRTTFEEAVRLVVAVVDRADWAAVSADIESRTAAAYRHSMETAHQILVAAGYESLAANHFSR